MPQNSATQKKWIFVTLFGAILTLVAILAPYFLDHPLWTATKVDFTDPSGDALVGTYHPGEIQAGVLLLEGFGSDQINMRSAASEFAQLGYHTFTFDFSGHGRSPGTLGYDNAETDRLAHQVMAAKEQFKTLSGLPDERIILLGHSLGARVALQAATMNPGSSGLILLGTQVNLSTNTQAEFFTGVSDADLEWVQALSSENPATNILMISGDWDDILSPEAAGLLAEKLSGQPLEPNSGVGEFDAGTRRDFVLFPRMLHNYEIFSPRVLATGKVWAGRALELSATPAIAFTAAIRIGCWIFGFVGLIIILVGAAGWLKSKSLVEESQPGNIEITSLRRFLIAKLLLWLGALPLGAILASIFFFLPIGLPTFNLIYVAFFGGYGILMYLLYRFGRLPGTQGRLPFTDSRANGRYSIWLALGVTAIMLMITAAYARTGWFFVYPLNMRLLWLVLFTMPTALGFWIGIYEINMIAEETPGKVIPQIGALLIGILPFFLYTAFLASMGSLSGVIGGIQGLLILGLALTFGYLLRQVTRVYWFVALCQALLLYWLILPQGVLFG
jgi:pimeloyl-ACP methyl ester carboxylesterase